MFQVNFILRGQSHGGGVQWRWSCYSCMAGIWLSSSCPRLSVRPEDHGHALICRMGVASSDESRKNHTPNASMIFVLHKLASPSMSFLKHWALRLSLLQTLRFIDDSSFMMVGLVCSSLVFMSRGTTRRSICVPLGDPDHEGTQRANVLISRTGPFTDAFMSIHFFQTRYWKNSYMLLFEPCRTVLVLLLATAKGATWVLEQPASSILHYHPRFSWLMFDSMKACVVKSLIQCTGMFHALHFQILDA